MVDTSKLDPNIKKFLDSINNQPHTLSKNIDIAAGREAYLMMALTTAGWPLKLARVEDLTVPTADGSYQIPIRIYTPELNKKLPALVYYHGGGWQRGDIATHDSICRHLAKFAGCIVVSVEWRLAPEHKFPTGPNDCLAVYEWVANNGDKYNIDVNRLAIGGDSAGGNMTAVTAQRLREINIIQPIFQLLLYPALDLSCSTWSYIDFAEGFFLTTERVKYYVNGYLSSPVDVDNPLASPGKQKDLSKLPRTHIVTAGFDPLRGEGEAYVHRLKDAGIPVTYTCYEGMVHAFLHMNHTVPAVEAALQEISGVLKDALK
jgi:acetyl esterase